MIKVIIADDHQLLIDGLRSLLDKKSQIKVVGVAKDGMEAATIALEQKPDIAILDVSMPKLNGIDTARRIIRDLPETKVLMLSMHAEKRYIQEALRVGARGYILKESAASEVIEAINSVMRGELFFSHSVRDQVLRDYVNMIKDEPETVESPLSGREREVLQILAEGVSTKDAAAMLNISIKTVETHRKQIMDKLDLHSIAELTKYAIREGLTQLD